MSSQPSLSLRAVALATLLASTGSGCSWAFVQRAPEPVVAPDYPLSCTDSRAAPVLDTICAGYFVLNGLVWASSSDTANKGTGLGVSAAFLALCALSAYSGYNAVGRCEQLKALNALCITGHEEACQTLRPGWTPPLRLPARAPQPPAVPAAPPAPPAAPPAP